MPASAPRALVALAAAVLLALLAPGAHARPAADVAFRTVERSSGTGSRLDEQRTIVVRSLRKYRQVWRQLHSTPKKRPKVDFARHMLILVTQGEKPNGGYGIDIEHIAAEEGEVILHVREAEPDPAATQCAYPQVITRPYHLVRVRRTARPIAPVQRRTELISC
jgi:hypothetical protein